MTNDNPVSFVERTTPSNNNRPATTEKFDLIAQMAAKKQIKVVYTLPDGTELPYVMTGIPYLRKEDNGAERAVLAFENPRLIGQKVGPDGEPYKEEFGDSHKPAAYYKGVAIVISQKSSLEGELGNIVGGVVARDTRNIKAYFLNDEGKSEEFLSVDKDGKVTFGLTGLFERSISCCNFQKYWNEARAAEKTYGEIVAKKSETKLETTVASVLAANSNGTGKLIA